MGDRRTLPWPGSYSARDLGGLPTHDGRSTRAGAVVRSESPSWFQRSAWPQMEAYGIETCIDLRSDWEVDAGPYTCPPGITRMAAPLEDGLLDDPAFAELAAAATLSTALYFGPFLERWPDRAAAAVRAVGDAAPGGVLFHCERGRDRTGLIALLLLGLVGVPDDVIIAEHLATDDLLRDRGVALGHVSLDGEGDLYAAAGTDAETTLVGLLADLDASALLRSAGATTDEIQRLRDRLIA